MDPSTHYTLRVLTVLGFPPAAAFLFAHLIVVRRVVPAIGLIPFASSTLVGVVHVYHAKRGRPLAPGAAVLFDVAIAIVMFSILIPSVIDSLRHWHPAECVLATYGICFMWVDFFIHVYLIIQACRQWTWMHCPHCTCAAHERASQIRSVYPYYADHKPAYERRGGQHPYVSDGEREDEDEGVPRTSMSTSIVTVGDLTPPSTDNLSLGSSTGSKTLF